MATELRTCYRHPDHPAGVVCQRCDRPICPQCMHQASVGFHCPECTRAGAQRVYTPQALRTAPRLAQVLIGINVAVFVLGVVLTGGSALSGRSELINDGGLIAATPNFVGTLVPVGVGDGEWYRILTSGFLHYGIIHLGFNMFALWVLGQFLEPSIGRLKFGLIYVVSLLGGSLGALLLTPDALTAGASGAIYGLMGAALAVQRSRGIGFRESGLVSVLVLNLLFTFAVPGISIGGHLGGLVGGFVSGWILANLPARLRNETVPVALCIGVGLAFVAASLSVAASAA